MIANLRSRIDIIERSERGEGRDPEEFLSWAHQAWPTTWVQQYEKMTSKDPAMAKNEAERREIFRTRAAQVFRSQLQGVLNQHAHELFGGAQSEKGSGGGEIGRGNQEVGPTSPVHVVRDFLNRRDEGLAQEAYELKSQLDPVSKILLRFRTGNGMATVHTPRAGVPLPPKPPVPPSTGQVSAPPLRPPSAVAPNLQDSEGGIVNTGRPR